MKVKYKFEWADISALLTLLNVTLVLLGWYYAPIVGIVNCILNLILNVKYKSHLNLYLIQASLIVLNCYFLTL